MMAEAELQSALDRIAAALTRLERIDVPELPRAGIAEAYALLDERHGLLRLRVQETIDRLDALIAQPEGASA